MQHACASAASSTPMQGCWAEPKSGAWECMQRAASAPAQVSWRRHVWGGGGAGQRACREWVDQQVCQGPLSALVHLPVLVQSTMVNYGGPLIPQLTEPPAVEFHPQWHFRAIVPQMPSCDLFLIRNNLIVRFSEWSSRCCNLLWPTIVNVYICFFLLNSLNIKKKVV